MICPNCKKEIPDGSEKCPHCQSEVNSNVKRCPDCWTRVTEKDVNCPKCGCDIKERIKEIDEQKNAVEPTIIDKIKLLPRWVKITVPSVLLAFIIIVSAVCIYLDFSRKSEAAYLADDYIISVDIALGEITKLAQAYEDMVYGQSWLDRTGSAAAVREVYAEDIALIKRTREPIYYSKTRIEEKKNDAINVRVNKLYENYAKCYNYVIGENGKYPGYMDEYKRLVSEYEKSVKELKKVTEKYK